MDMAPKRRLEFVSGKTHPGLAEEIASCLGVTLSETNIRGFADGEIHCRFDASMRGVDMFIVQTQRAGERLHHGAADHGRRRQARFSAPDHRRVPRLRVLTPGPQGHGREPSRPSRSRTCSRLPASTGS